MASGTQHSRPVWNVRRGTPSTWSRSASAEQSCRNIGVGQRTAQTRDGLIAHAARCSRHDRLPLSRQLAFGASNWPLGRSRSFGPRHAACFALLNTVASPQLFSRICCKWAPAALTCVLDSHSAARRTLACGTAVLTTCLCRRVGETLCLGTPSRCVRAPRSSTPSHAASAAFCSAPASTVIPIVPQTCLTAPRADTTHRKAPPLPPPH